MVYYDLNIPIVEVYKKEEMCEEIKKSGYKCIALNYKCKKGERPMEASTLERFEGLPTSIRQLKRLTCCMEDMNSVYSLTFTNPLLTPYDLIAVEPESSRVFEYLCTEAEVDIIVVNARTRLSYLFRKSLINKAIERGVYFEISYSNSLCDSGSRRYFISNLISLTKATNGRNVILSSSTPYAIFLRSPYEVATIAQLTGISYIKAMDTICNYPQQLIEKVDKRKRENTTI